MRKNLIMQLRAGKLQEEKNLIGRFACSSELAVRRNHDENAARDHRLAFAIDADRILYSRAYARYIDKTQVFSLVPNDHITHRALHVQFLSKIARTIGSYLKLNQDLIEAIALGHDIGHPPFGHDGEGMLSEFSEKYLKRKFFHNVQSVRVLDMIEKGGKGLNLCLQTLDGILCHNGEEDYKKSMPEKRDGFDGLDILFAATAKGGALTASPCTLEGCLVKICDTISYIGRDLEDAIILKIVKRSDLPSDVAETLGDTAGKIVYNLVVDIITESAGKGHISLSADAAEAMHKLKNFNRKYIYGNKKIKTQHDKLKKMMSMMLEEFLNDLENENRDSAVYRSFLAGMSEKYVNTTEKPRVVIDFIATMTDRYFMDTFKEKFLAESLPRYF